MISLIASMVPYSVGSPPNYYIILVSKFPLLIWMLRGIKSFKGPLWVSEFTELDFGSFGTAIIMAESMVTLNY